MYSACGMGFWRSCVFSPSKQQPQGLHLAMSDHPVSVDCLKWKKNSLFAIKVMKMVVIKAIKYYFLFWKRTDINTVAKNMYWRTSSTWGLDLQCFCFSYRVWQGSSREYCSIFNFKLLSRRPSRIICSVNIWSWVLAFLFTQQTRSQMLNVREKPKAFVFYQAIPFPRIYLVFFFWCIWGKKW